MAEVRAARRALLGAVSLYPKSANQCIDRAYNRLNSDYALLHALARFFLERMNPGVSRGDHDFLPFTVEMPFLFQEYVVAVLRQHAPDGLTISRQYAVEPTGDFKVRFSIDAVVRNDRTGEVLAVVDAKYKADPSPSASDVQQVIAYAAQTGASHAFLVYPHSIMEGQIAVGLSGRLQVSSLGHPLDGNLTKASSDLAQRIFKRIERSGARGELSST